MERGFATIALKSLSEEKREFTGLATSPVPDRVLDIIDPLGCKYRNPTVLLRAHDHAMPIGEVHFDRPTKTGIGFRAKIPNIPEPGPLKDRVDMAWGEVKHGLIRAVSVGFRPLEAEPLPTGGIRYTKSEIFELSTVAVPAQELATIDQVKAIDAAVRRGDVPSTATALVGSDYAKKAMGILTAVRHKDSQSVLYTQGQHNAIAMGFQVLFEGIDTIAAKTAELQRQFNEQGSTYKGIWKPDRSYSLGEFVTHGGSMWHCDKTTDRKPGEGDWTLAVKRGADAR